MLHEMQEKSFKRKCTGRGQLNNDWEATVHNATYSLQRVPYYGMLFLLIFICDKVTFDTDWSEHFIPMPFIKSLI